MSVPIFQTGFEPLIDYSLFASACAEYGYTFEPHLVTTEDHWQLTVFHITGYVDDEAATEARAQKTAGKEPVLAVPGSFGDAEHWFNDAKDGKPMHLQLFDEGFDIWMGNNRGTKYSDVNFDYPDASVETPERWDFSWAELGMYDDPAFMDKILAETGAAKVNYIGYSMGTTQMFYGLTAREEAYYADHMNKFVALAPCIYMEDTSYETYQEGWGAMRTLGIDVLLGPDWALHTKDICANLSQHWCNWASTATGEAQPTKSREWYYQVAVEQRFQQYLLDYESKEVQTPLIDPWLDSIDKVPIHMIVGGSDTHCSLEHAQRAQKEIGAMAKSIDVIDGFGHGSFESATDFDSYVSVVLKRLLEDESSQPGFFLQ